ncbi:muts domain V-domain-containing protein [Phyllosticta citrichinensis]|uniref:Muts domain V-domain-containing protein n=1 Tax=Phyllosticta citrichinensis TaxID=1130410 RepID=A0ABR1Y2N8_9PEZI
MGLRPALVAIVPRSRLSSPRALQISPFRPSPASCPAFGLSSPGSCQPQPWRSLLVRGKRTTTLKANELPQGPIDAAPLDNLDDDAGPAYPTVMQQVRNNMRKFPHCVVLTRVGNFYELYFEHAEHYGPLLALKVAHKKTSVGPVFMAGFPYFQLDRFLKILVQDLQKHVAISEEIRNDVSSKIKAGGLMFDRQISRIITPGTLIDEKFLDPWENNYCLSIHVDPSPSSSEGSEGPAGSQSGGVGLAWVDISSGEFFTQSTTFGSLSSAVALIGPREIVLDQSHQDRKDSHLLKVLEGDRHKTTFHEAKVQNQSPNGWVATLKETLGEFQSDSYQHCELGAAGFLLEFVRTQLQRSDVALEAPVRRQASEYMSIDINTMKALELKETLREGKLEGTLLHAVRRTSTKGGARLLTQRLISPSLSLGTINERLDLVERFLGDEVLRQRIVGMLSSTADSTRLVQKFAMGKGDADDLLALSKTIQLTEDVFNTLESAMLDDETASGSVFSGLLNRLSLQGPKRLAKRISVAIDEEGLSEQHRIEADEAATMVGLAAEVLSEEGEEKTGSKRKQTKSKQSERPGNSDTGPREVWIMRRSASKALERLHRDLGERYEQREELGHRLRETAGTSGLTLRWSSGLGHHVHVKGSKGNMANVESARIISSSRSTRSYSVPEWNFLGSKIDDARSRIRSEEQRVSRELRAEVVLNLVKMRRNATVLDELDVACSFATLTEEKGFVRPLLNHRTSHKIVGGKHPVVEAGLLAQGRNFTSNACSVGEDERILLITGPNMAGKSTFLRQNALISVLAQTGSFVPAQFAEIGLVDKIFSRVGSADNLYQDQSTFMVEMLETAEILKQATPRSFVIMDEVGRGTTPEDGIAVGYACLHHLYHINKCRALFATHFHKLADMTEGFEKLGCYCTDVEESADGTFAYVHRLRKGVNRKSHALKVAQVAGMPKEAIEVANEVLKGLETPAL